jgi:hypothetical protein
MSGRCVAGTPAGVRALFYRGTGGSPQRLAASRWSEPPATSWHPCRGGRTCCPRFSAGFRLSSARFARALPHANWERANGDNFFAGRDERRGNGKWQRGEGRPALWGDGRRALWGRRQAGAMGRCGRRALWGDGRRALWGRRQAGAMGATAGRRDGGEGRPARWGRGQAGAMRARAGGRYGARASRRYGAMRPAGAMGRCGRPALWGDAAFEGFQGAWAAGRGGGGGGWATQGDGFDGGRGDSG